MTDAAIEQGLSSATAAKRLRELGPPAEDSSRSVSSIVAGNVFTLFNAIIGAFFVLDLGLGLYADSIFGLIAVINSYIGIRQELKAKRTLDELAVLVAPRAKVIRDGAAVDLLSDEVVPGDVIAIEPGDQLVADGEVITSVNFPSLDGYGFGYQKFNRRREDWSMVAVAALVKKAGDGSCEDVRIGLTHMSNVPLRATAAEVASVLRNHGWNGTARPCSPGCPVQRDLPR